MKYRSVFLIFLSIFLSASSLFAQKKINEYKYILVPKQYEFQKYAEQYDLNSLTKFLFEKEGFEVLFTTDTFPADLASNPCLALKAVVKNNSGFLKTKLVYSLIDCYNNAVYTSTEGVSKIKDYKKAYHDAARKAFVGIQSLNYEYDGSVPENINVVAKNTSPKKQEVAKVEEKNDAVVIETVKKAEQKAATPVKVEETVVAAETVAMATPKQVEKENKVVYSIEGTYFIDMWGECVISKKGSDYTIVGGDENFEFAKIFTTSKPTIFMVKKTGFSKSSLLELDADGNLKIDSKNGVKIYKRIK